MLNWVPDPPITGIEERAVAEPDEILVRRGKSVESARRLGIQAAAAERSGCAQNGTPYGHGISVTSPESNARLARVVSDAVYATRRALERAGFEVRYTPTTNDSDHHTVQLPKPVTDESARRFNAAFGRE